MDYLNICMYKFGINDNNEKNDSKNNINNIVKISCKNCDTIIYNEYGKQFEIYDPIECLMCITTWCSLC